MELRFDFPYITVTGLAKHLGITPGAVIMLIKNGDLPSLVKVGNRMFFERHELERWEKDHLKNEE